MNFGAAALIGATVYTAMNLLKYLRARDTNGSVTIVASWIVGVGVVMLSSAAEITNSFVFNDIALGDMDAGSKIILGLQATSLFAHVPAQIIKALDGSDSAATPALVPPAKVITPTGEAVAPPVVGQVVVNNLPS